MDSSQFDKMLLLVSQKLGMTPEALKNAAMTGNTDEIFSHLDKDSLNKVKAVMSDKEAQEKILKNLKGLK